MSFHTLLSLRYSLGFITTSITMAEFEFKFAYFVAHCRTSFLDPNIQRDRYLKTLFF